MLAANWRRITSAEGNPHWSAMFPIGILVSERSSRHRSRRVLSIVRSIVLPVTALKRSSAMRREHEKSASTSRGFSPPQASLRMRSTAFSTSVSRRLNRRVDCRRMGLNVNTSDSAAVRPPSSISIARSAMMPYSGLNVVSDGLSRSHTEVSSPMPMMAMSFI